MYGLDLIKHLTDPLLKQLANFTSLFFQINIIIILSQVPNNFIENFDLEFSKFQKFDWNFLQLIGLI